MQWDSKYDGNPVHPETVLHRAQDPMDVFKSARVEADARKSRDEKAAATLKQRLGRRVRACCAVPWFAPFGSAMLRR